MEAGSASTLAFPIALVRVLRTAGHEVLVAVADAAFHDLSVAAFWVLVASVSLAKGTGSVALAFTAEEVLDVVGGEHERGVPV